MAKTDSSNWNCLVCGNGSSGEYPRSHRCHGRMAMPKEEAFLAAITELVDDGTIKPSHKNTTNADQRRITIRLAGRWIDCGGSCASAYFAERFFFDALAETKLETEPLDIESEESSHRKGKDQLNEGNPLRLASEPHNDPQEFAPWPIIGKALCILTGGLKHGAETGRPDPPKEHRQGVAHVSSDVTRLSTERIAIR